MTDNSTENKDDWGLQHKNDFFSAQNDKSIVRLILNNATEYEEKFGKDLAAFSKEEAIEYLKGIDSFSSDTLRGYTSIIRRYIKFCTGYQIEGIEANGWSKITAKVIKNQCVAEQKLEDKCITRDELESILKDVNNDCDKFMLLAFYEGLKGDYYEDIWQTTLENFEKEGDDWWFTSKDGTRRFIVSDLLYHYAQSSVEKFEYIIDDGVVKTELRLSPDCEYIFKYRDNTSNPDESYRGKARVAQRVMTLKKQIGASQLTIPRLVNSGAVGAIKALAKEMNVKPEVDVLIRKMGKLTEEDEKIRERVNKIRERYGLTAPASSLRDKFARYLD